MAPWGRREFLGLLGGATAWPLVIGGTALGWPRAACAQQRPMWAIGLLNGQSSPANTNLIAAFRQGLAEVGYTEGRNLAIVYRGAEGDVARLPALAAELVQIPVAVIAAVGGDSSVRSAKAATATIPIVFTTASDPVEAGIVASLNRPGGNVTGATFLGSLLASKQIGLLRELVPQLTTIGLLTSPFVPMAVSVTEEVQTAAKTQGLKAVVVNISGERDLEAAFAQFTERRIDALVISSGAIFSRMNDRLIAFAARHTIPAISSDRRYPADGGLMSYGAGIGDAYRQAALYVGRILRGDKPGDLPVVQPTKFELVINMKTARALGLTVPPGLLAIADEVIE